MLEHRPGRRLVTFDGAARLAPTRIAPRTPQMSGVVFFISYIFVAGIVMTNVVVAILLEKYLGLPRLYKMPRAN